MRALTELVQEILGVAAMALGLVLVLAGPVLIFLIGLLLPLEIPVLLLFLIAAGLWESISHR